MRKIRRRAIRTLASVGITLMLAACGFSPTGSPWDTKLDPSAQAVVIFGVSAQNNPTVGTLSVGWAKFDPATREISPSRGFSWWYTVNPIDPGAAREVQHVVFVAEPGHYILSHARIDEPNFIGGAINTAFFKGLMPHLAQSSRGTSFAVDRASAGGLTTTARVAEDSTAPRFALEAGETVYVGTYSIDFRAQPFRLVGTGRDDAAARAELAQYPFGGRAIVWREARAP